MLRPGPKLLVALLAACAALAAAWYLVRSPVPAPAAPRDAAKIAMPMHPTSLLAHVALDQGYFAAHGLDVSVKEYPSGKRALDDGLFAGLADITWSNETPVALAGFQRQDFRIVSTTLTADNVNMIIARRDSGIERPEDLRGKRIATQKGSAVHFFLHLFLLEHGLTEQDVRLSFLKAEELPAALASGAIDAFSMRDPYISQARTLLGEEQAITFRAPRIYDQMDVMVMRQDILEKSPGVATKALRAMLDAQAYVVNHPQETVALMARRQDVTASREDLQREIEVRIRTEAALRKSEQNLQKAQAIAHLGSWERDIQTGQIWPSDEVYRIFGRLPGQQTLTYEAFLEAVHPEDRPLVAQSVEGALHGKGYDIEHRILQPDGEVRVVHQIGEVEFDNAGKPLKMLGTVHEHSARPLRMLGTLHDITERKRVEDKLRQANEHLGAQLLEIEQLHATLREQAIHDSLTGLFNRRYMEETLEREFSGAEREHYPVSLVMMDIDHFKKINDTYGHQTGDRVLQNLSALLNGHIRGRDIACRYGGEEFLAVLPHTPIEAASQRAELWRASFAALRMSHEGKDFSVTISLGVAAYAAHGKTGQAVLSAADKALYAAKSGGRNRVVVAT